MQPWVRRLSIAALAIVGAVAWMVSTPAVLAYEEAAPGDGKLIRAWQPRYGAVAMQQKRDNEGGPVELPHPIETPEMHTSWAGPMSMAPDSGKGTALGALPAARGGGGGFDAGAQAERRIQRVIRRLG